jgi:hypothetical protein
VRTKLTTGLPVAGIETVMATAGATAAGEGTGTAAVAEAMIGGAGATATAVIAATITRATVTRATVTHAIAVVVARIDGAMAGGPAFSVARTASAASHPSAPAPAPAVWRRRWRPSLVCCLL